MDSAPTKVRQARLALLDRAQLFSVLVDLNSGRSYGPPSWLVTKSSPQPLQLALSESNELRSSGWITKLEPET